MKDYNKKINNLQKRRTDTLIKKAILSDSFSKSDYNTDIKWVLEAMQPVSSVYTRNTYEACEKIQNYIKPTLNDLGYSVEFRYQGSVPLNTHIRTFSDIDQLVITNKYFTLEPPQQPVIPYKGNPIDDLTNIRSTIVRTIMQKFPSVTIDDKGSKAIALSGGSLNRRVDVVPANWYKSIKYKETEDSDYKGIQLLDRDKGKRIVNFPFLFIWWINYKDDQVNGNLKRLVRFLKNVKADFNDENSSKINISSYDISSLIFRMENSQLNMAQTHSLSLLSNCYTFFNEIISKPSFRDELYTANNTRTIFGTDGAKISDLVSLNNELREIIEDLNRSIKPLYENLQKAYYSY